MNICVCDCCKAGDAILVDLCPKCLGDLKLRSAEGSTLSKAPLTSAGDACAIALEAYLMAGTKEKRREASDMAKQALNLLGRDWRRLYKGKAKP